MSKDGTHSKSHQFLNPPNEVPTFVAILDFFWRKINRSCSSIVSKDGTYSKKPSILEREKRRGEERRGEERKGEERRGKEMRGEGRRGEEMRR